MPNKKKSKRTTSKTVTKKRMKKSSSETEVRRGAKTAKKQQSQKKRSKKKSSFKKALAPKRPSPRGTSQPFESSRAREGGASEVQSGDLEGLSRAEQADSESVDELVEEGNVFEAGAVAGVEEADDNDTKEVHTHQVPEDDVPDEYLEND